MWPRGIGITEQSLRCSPGRFGPAEQHGRIDVALESQVGVTSLNVSDVDAPVDAQDFAGQAGVRVHEMGRVLQEQDPGDAGPTDGCQHGLEMRTNQALPVLEGQEAGPGIENLHGVRPGPPLGDEIVPPWHPRVS